MCVCHDRIPKLSLDGSNGGAGARLHEALADSPIASKNRLSYIRYAVRSPVSIYCRSPFRRVPARMSKKFVLTILDHGESFFV